MKNPLKCKIDGRRALVEFRIRHPDELAWLGSAYLSTEEAYVALDRQGGEEVAILWPKRNIRLANIAAAFAREYDNQLHRWNLLRLNRAVRAETLRRALALADESGVLIGRAQPRLAAGQMEEIERLLAEAEEAPKDPLGIAKPWEELRTAKAGQV